MIKKFIMFLSWVLLGILALLGFVSSVGHCFVDSFPFGVLERFGIIIGEKTLNLAILYISAFYLIVCYIKISGRDSVGRSYEIQTENGIVHVSSDIVTDAVKEILGDDKEISNIKVNAKKNGKKFDIEIVSSISTDVNLASKSSDIQRKIKSNITDRIGIEVGSVQVRVNKFPKKSKAETKSEPVDIVSDDDVKPQQEIAQNAQQDTTQEQNQATNTEDGDNN